MTDKIKQDLAEMAERDNIHLLFACESGSRGWGFESPNSDFDIRFLYVYTADKYLMIDNLKEDYSAPVTSDNLDFGGWELRKTLRLTRGGNVILFEWLQSPIVYTAQADFQAELWSAIYPYFAPRTALHHYLGIAKNALETATQTGQIKIKKYFYILRPLLAAMWIAAKNDVPPMNFHALRTLIDEPRLNEIIDNLLVRKEKALESEMIDLIPELQIFIHKEWKKCDEISKLMSKKESTSTEPLNQFIKKWINT